MATVASTARVSSRKRPAKPRQGIVKALVAVTGVKDDVGDIIQPGILAAALVKRRPKAVFHHEVADFIGRVELLEEWLPGDSRLPEKQPNGLPWPPDAGAWVATIQFNMNVERARDAFEWARFYAESGEAAWSIGYMVPKGMAAKRNGIRFIYGIDLFEVSLVLHGAHPLTMALEVKSAHAAVRDAKTAEGAGVLERKQAPNITLPALGGGDQVEELEDDVDHTPAGMRPPMPETKDAGAHDDDVMVALYPDEATANTLAVKGGEPAGNLHVTLAYLGKKDSGYGPDDVVAAVRKALAGRAEPLAGQIGGIGVFPGDEEEGTPVWAPVDVPGLEKLRERVVDELDAHPALAGRVARNHGFTPHMTLGFDLDEATPVPPTPVKFGHAVVVHGNDRYPVPFGQPAAVMPAGVLETKAAHLAVQQARAATPALETKMNRMKGSYEERARLLDRALQDRLVKARTVPEGGGMESHCWVNTEATFDDHVVATVHDDEPRTFDVPYSWDGTSVKLGEPVEVQLDYVPAPGSGSTAPDPVDRALVPTLDTLSAAAVALGALPLETKNLAAAYPVVSGLLRTLAGKGMDVLGAALGEEYDALHDPHMEDDDPSYMEEKDRAGHVSATPDVDPSASDEPFEDEDEVDPGLEPSDFDVAVDEERMSLDPDEVRAELDALAV